jgi:hypothetical protein
MYDFVLVEPGPLPPHERSWRHPSELGPTRVGLDVDVDHAGRRSSTGIMALAGGTMAVLAVAVMVVAITPRTSSGPVAMIATTTPIAAPIITPAVVKPPASTTPATPDITPVEPRTALVTSFAAFPHAVTPGPQLDLDGTAVADEFPTNDEMVFLRTAAVTYHLPWGDAQQLPVPDGSVVFDADGDLVARVSAGELLSLVDD